MLDGWEWFAFLIQHLTWMDHFSIFVSIMVMVAAFSFLLCVCVCVCNPYSLSLSPFSSLLCLLSCLRCRYLSTRSSLFRFFLSLPSRFCFIPLSLLRRVSGFISSFFAVIPTPSSSSSSSSSSPLLFFPDVVLSSYNFRPTPDRTRATAYCTYAFSSKV